MSSQIHIFSSVPTSIEAPSFGTLKNSKIVVQSKKSIVSFSSIHVASKFSIKCSDKQGQPIGQVFRTCKNCKTQFDPALNHPRACRYHTAHFGGETRRKFESVYSGGTMNTPESGKVFQYWHCCGSEDPFDSGCTAAPHVSYDD
ncbi:hypothetical protein LIER_37761 [Lithospermum erythrorhizon]|uniref:Uncharacterized protein n=1 Tax=Lithospermum erythrorhizon TaxID=34254 RepID=A0AAV3PRL5_LITER